MTSSHCCISLTIVLKGVLDFIKCSLGPVSTQENKHRIRLDFFPSCILSASPDQNKVKILYHLGCGSQVQTGTENWYRNSLRGFNFLPIRSDPMLIFLSGNQPSDRLLHFRQVIVK